MLLERTEILQSESETRLLRLEEKTVGDKAKIRMPSVIAKSMILGQEEHWNPRLECRIEGSLFLFSLLYLLLHLF